MDLLYNRIALYNRIILYNRTISSLVLFIFTAVTFAVFDLSKTPKVTPVNLVSSCLKGTGY